MSYHIHITVTAERDVINASDHIEFVLKNPKAADDLLDEAERQIYSLADFPEKFKLVDDSVLASWGVRFVVVNGYLASRLFVTITFYPAGRKSITENSIARLHSAVNHAPMQPGYAILFLLPIAHPHVQGSLLSDIPSTKKHRNMEMYKYCHYIQYFLK